MARRYSTICAIKLSSLVFAASSLVVAATMFICPWVINDYIVDIARRGHLPFISSMLQFYKEEKGTFPTQAQGLQALKGDYLREIPIDPWGNNYVYRVKANGDFVLYSIGKNKLDENGFGDDVVLGSKEYKCEDYGINCFDPCEFARMVAFFAALIALGVTVILAVAWMWSHSRRRIKSFINS